MIKKLRLKFIFINMLIVTIMLIFIFGVVYVSTQRNLERESIQKMSSVALNPYRLPPPNKIKEDLRLPYFFITADQNNEIVDMYGDLFDTSDTELLQNILNEAASSQGKKQVLKKYNLRFLYAQTPNGYDYTFMDISDEQIVLTGLTKNCIIIGVLAFIIFFCINIVLARWATGPIENAWKQQKQFVADASHELKTPLTVIMTDAELLHEQACSEAEQKHLSAGIISMAQQMRGLVESMLELARIDSGSITDPHTSFSLSELYQNSAMVFEPVFFEKNLIFNYDIESGLELSANKSQLKQLADILLDNAAKYSTPNGNVHFILKAISSGKYQICVSGQGEAIPQAELNNLFKRFYRLDKARTSSHSYGLGLSIAESIVHEHHGKIWAESKDGYNSFFIELPK